ncbi:LPXTG cell wall anchor domain-containing protein [Ligilactobacillus animalis]
MGDADNNSIAVLGAVMITSLLSLFGFASKKKKDEENI